jgi:hypothetical protein
MHTVHLHQIQPLWFLFNRFHSSVFTRGYKVLWPYSLTLRLLLSPSPTHWYPLETRPVLHLCYSFLYVCGTGVWTHVFMLAKQALNLLSHTSSPFCSGYFGDGVSRTVCPGWPLTDPPDVSLPKLGLQAWLTSARLLLFIFITFFFVCVWNWGLNSGFHAC